MGVVQAVMVLNLKVHAAHYNRMIEAETKALGGHGGVPRTGGTAVVLMAEGGAPGGPA